jgi:hypothetical protein
MIFRKPPPRRPGRVARLLGVILQDDGASRIGGWFIRPIETLDRRLAGADRPAPASYPGLAMHAGLHLIMDDGREMVAEQLVGTLRNNLSDGLNWTPIEQFRERNRGGWDVTVPATAFRGVDEAACARIVDRLNGIGGRPFLLEDCTGFVERVFERRLFADSPLLQRIGLGVRLGDPALPLLRHDVPLDKHAADLVRADVASRLPDPRSGLDSPTMRLVGRALWLALVSTLVVRLLTRRRRGHDARSHLLAWLPSPTSH